MKILFSSLVLACAPLAAQSLIPSAGECANDADAARLQNSAALEVSVVLDRPEYLPGEVMTFTISLRNAGDKSVEVFDPWQTGGVGVEIATTATDNPQRVRYRVPNHAYAGIWLGCGGSALWVQPGETLSRQFRSNQPLTDPETPAVSGEGAPAASGSYLFAVMYRSREVMRPFRVVRPVVESLRAVKLGEHYVHGYVLREGDMRVLGMDARPGGELQLETLRVSDLRAWMRMGELGPDESLAALEETSPGEVALKVQSANGVSVRLRRTFKFHQRD